MKTLSVIVLSALYAVLLYLAPQVGMWTLLAVSILLLCASSASFMLDAQGLTQNVISTAYSVPRSCRVRMLVGFLYKAIGLFTLYLIVTTVGFPITKTVFVVSLLVGNLAVARANHWRDFMIRQNYPNLK